MPHEDGAAYYPLVATVSLGAPIVLDLFTKSSRGQRDDEKANEEASNTTDQIRKPQYRILQERRSLLVTKADLYKDYLHGIAETTRDEDLSADTICNWDLLREKELYHAGWYERETRTSLTYRDVLKVAKMGNSVKFLGGR
jgi:alkylated DNA repair protein alkB family protein 6